MEETRLVGVFVTKGVLEFVVKILGKFAYKEFLKIQKRNRSLLMS